VFGSGGTAAPPVYTNTAIMVTASRNATIRSALLEKFHSNMVLSPFSKLDERTPPAV
jgi:hypothetical protein